MDWFNVIATFALGLIGALGGGSIMYWKASRKSAEAEAQKNTTEARSAEVDLTEKIMEKFQRIVLDRMDLGDAVRQQEFKDLTQKIDKRFDVIEEADRKQTETLQDVVEYLNGGFQQFEEQKHKMSKKKRDINPVER